MTKEELFLAIGEVEGSRLIRSEMAMQGSSEETEKERPNMTKKHIRFGRLLRNMVAAVLLIFALGTTAYAVVGYVIYDSPAEMVEAIFGDNTGYDHKGVTHWTDPEKPGSLYDNPAYDRVEADETVVAEDIAPYVSPVGKSVSYQDYTLTVDGYLYDPLSGCGFVTYLLENPNGVSCYEIFENGMLNLNSAPHRMNQYGYDYIIQEKTTDTCLAATFYFRMLHLWDEDLVIKFPYEGEPRTDEENNAIMKELDARVRGEYTPEEAVALVKAEMGETQFKEYHNEVPAGIEMTQEEWEADAAYTYLRSEIYFAEYEQVGPHITIPVEGEALNHVTAEKGSVLVTPVCIQIDVTNMEFLREKEKYSDDTYLSADNVDDVLIRYEDGSDYHVSGDNVQNTVFGIIDSATNGEKDTSNRLTYMFNRIIDVDKVTAVVINGVELAVD